MARTTHFDKMPTRFNKIDDRMVVAGRGQFVSFSRYKQLYMEYRRVRELLELRELIEKDLNGSETRAEPEAMPIVLQPTGVQDEE